MNIRPDAWRRALRSPQVIISVLALVAALVAVFLARPEAVEAEPFELPAVQPRELHEEEVRLVTYDRFNLEIPVRELLQVPADAAGRTEAIVAAVKDLMSENGAWPETLPLPVVFAETLSGQLTAVADFRLAGGESPEPAELARVARSVTETLLDAGIGQVVILVDGQAWRPPPDQDDPV